MRLLVQTLAGLLALAAAGPTPSSQPTIAGTLQVGAKLTASPGRWSGEKTISYTYQWYRCDPLGAHCSSIHGATRGTYRIVPKDAGQTLGLTVRGADTTGVTSAYAALAGIVSPIDATVAPTKQPTLSGAAIVGGTLTVGSPSWTVAPATPSYAWLRCNANGRICAPIDGATTTSYTLVADDVGHVVLGEVTASRRTALSLSAGVVRAKPGPLATSLPAVTGTLRQGAKLTASAGTWSGSGTITYAYQWSRCDASGAHCSAIRGATRGTYTEVAADVGHTIGLAVRATDPTGASTAYAPLAGTIAPVDGSLAATAQPTLTGTAAVGQTLTISPGGWTAAPGPLAYAWLRCNVNGRLCTAIAGAVASTYTLVADDAGHTVVATVTATAGTSSVAVLAVASAVVAS